MCRADTPLGYAKGKLVRLNHPVQKALKAKRHDGSLGSLFTASFWRTRVSAPHNLPQLRQPDFQLALATGYLVLKSHHHRFRFQSNAPDFLDALLDLIFQGEHLCCCGPAAVDDGQCMFSRDPYVS